MGRLTHTDDSLSSDYCIIHIFWGVPCYLPILVFLQITLHTFYRGFHLHHILPLQSPFPRHVMGPFAIVTPQLLQGKAAGGSTPPSLRSNIIQHLPQYPPPFGVPRCTVTHRDHGAGGRVQDLHAHPPLAGSVSSCSSANNTCLLVHPTSHMLQDGQGTVTSLAARSTYPVQGVSGA